MDYKELFLESLRTLTLNKIRTGLAMLGVIIGIGSVISLMSLGQASQRSVEGQIRSLGANLLTVQPGVQQEGRIKGSASSETLTLSDAEAIKSSKDITAVEGVAPVYQDRAQVIAGRENTNITIYGVTANYAAVRNVGIISGEFISEQQVLGTRKVAVLGPQTAEDLFGEEANPLGSTVRIENIAFTIIGITESKGSGDDDAVYVPLTSAQKLLFGVSHLSSIYITAKDDSVMEEARNQVGYLLLERHRIKNPEEADFSIMSQEDLLGTVGEVTGTFTTLLSGIAAISLVVGGIGIMNIMLVTVTERTREIGLRKALGAKRKYITAQFLIESVLITFVGGLIGVVLGIGAFYIMSNSMDLPFVVSPPSVLLAFGVSATIGVIFGWYPAQKAARLAPIDALRYE